jgi:hypothetical protein
MICTASGSRAVLNAKEMLRQGVGAQEYEGSYFVPGETNIEQGLSEQGVFVWQLLFDVLWLHLRLQCLFRLDEVNLPELRRFGRKS